MCLVKLNLVIQLLNISSPETNIFESENKVRQIVTLITITLDLYLFAIRNNIGLYIAIQRSIVKLTTIHADIS